MTKWQLDDLFQRSQALLNTQKAPDAARAFALNSSAAQEGHREATFMMGWFYLHGAGTESDPEQARAWYRESARQGEPRAMFELGRLAYRDSEPREAFAWFRRACDLGHLPAFYALAKLHARGHGTPPDPKIATALLERSAAKGLKKAQRALRLFSKYEGRRPLPTRRRPNAFVFRETV